MVIGMENNATVMCFALCLKLTSWRRPKNVTMQESLKDAIRTSLRNYCDTG